MTPDQKTRILTATLEKLTSPEGAYDRNPTERLSNVIDHSVKLATLALDAMEDGYHPEPCAQEECWVCDILDGP